MEQRVKGQTPPAAGGAAAIIFITTAEYAAEEFWEGREETRGILHSIMAARSGVLDLWME